MYTFNTYVFGHNTKKDEKIHNLFLIYDLYFSEVYNGMKFEVDTPYHGGALKELEFPVIIGHTITDDDDNPDFLNEVRSSKEEDFIDSYQLFINDFKKIITDDIDRCDEFEKEEYEKDVNTILTFLDNNKPEFYLVECSS